MEIPEYFDKILVLNGDRYSLLSVSSLTSQNTIAKLKEGVLP